MLHRALSSAFALLLVLTIFALPQLASAQSDDQRAKAIRTMLVERDRDVKTILGTKKTFTSEQRQQLKEQITGIIDFGAMSQIALGSEWETLSAAQKKQFVDIFADYVSLNSLANLEIYRAQVSYDEISVEDDSAFVRTTTIYKDVPTQVDYVLGFSEENGWQVHDIILDDVSTAEGYRDTFRPVVTRKNGFDRLVKILQDRVAEERGKSSS